MMLCISLKMNLIAQLVFEFNYNNVTVQHVTYFVIWAHPDKKG